MRINLNPRKTGAVIAVIILVVIISVFYFRTVPKIINIEKHRPEIEKSIKQSMQVPVKLGKLSTSTTWNLGVRVNASSVDIKHNDGKEFVSAGPVAIEVSIPSLLRNQILIRQIDVSNAVIYLQRMSNGKFDIEQLVPRKAKKPSKYKFILKRSGISVKNYQVYFQDSFIKPPKKYALVGPEIKISDFNPAKYIKASAKGYVISDRKPNTSFDVTYSSQLPVNRKNALSKDLVLQGKISNFYPDMYMPYLNEYTSQKYSEMSGSANLDINLNFPGSRFRKDRFYVKALLDDVNVKKPDRGAIITIPDKAEILARGQLNNDLILDNFMLKNHQVNVQLNGKVINYKSKDKQLNLKLTIDNTDVANLARVFPKNIRVPFDPFRKILRRQVEGKVWTDLLIQGRPKTPDLYGKVRFNNVTIGKMIPGTPKSYGQIDFIGRTLNLDIHAFTDPNGRVKVSGMITPIKDKILDLSITSNKINVPKALEVLFTVRSIFRFKLGPVRYIEAKSGTGKVNLRIKGSFKTPSVPKIYGFVDIYNAVGSYELLYGVFKDIRGKLTFKGDRVFYNGATGYVDGSKAIAEGYSTLKGYSDVKLTFPSVDLTLAQNIITKSSLLDKLEKTLEDIKGAQGKADIVIYLLGDEENLFSKGNLVFHNASVDYAGYGERFKNINGKLSYVDEKVYFDNMTADVAQSKATMKGTIVGEKSVDLLITSPNVNLTAIRKFIYNSSTLKDVQKSLRKLTAISGNAAAELKLKGALNSKNLLDSLRLRPINRATFVYQDLGYPVDITSGEIFVTANRLSTGGARGKVLNIPITAYGQITGLASEEFIPDANIQFSKFHFAKLKDLVRAPLVPKEAKDFLSSFQDLKGLVTLNIDLKGKNYFNTILKFNDASARYVSGNIPIEVGSGELSITPERLKFTDIYSKISRSTAYLDGTVSNYDTQPVLNLLAYGQVNAKDIDEYINSYLANPINAKGNISVAALLFGKLDNWNTVAQLTLGKGDVLSYQSTFALPSDKIRVFSVKAEGTKNSLNIENLETAISDDPLEVALSASGVPGRETNLKRLLTVKGKIREMNTDNPLFDNLYVSTPSPFDITLLNPAIKTDTGRPMFSQGEFTGNVTLKGRMSNPQVLGKVSLNDVSVPSNNLLIDYADVDFNQDQIDINDSYINIANSPMKIQAKIVNFLERPAVIKFINIYSPSLNIDQIVEALRQPDAGDEKKRPQDIPPFVIEQGALKADELVISNLITKNVSSNFDFTPDWLLTLSNLTFQTAGGTATGQVLFNTKTTELAVSLNAKDMQANAAATTLLNLPNEVYGTLNGEAEFHTRGSNSQEMIANANGYANFKIIDGRLVRLGSLEYLLRAANVVQSGIAGLNVNNILDLIVPQQTGHFQEMNGTVTAKDGNLRTEGITSKGKNLSLFLSGDLDMVTNNADITILGRVSRKVSGLLGPLGSLSINTFIGFIPGLGFLPSTPETGLIDVIPGLSRIPALGLSTKRYRFFEVRIVGDLYDPTSVKSFRWIDPKLIRGKVFEQK